MTNPFDAVRSAVIDLDDPSGARTKFAHMPIGEAVDMGHAIDGTSLIDPRIFDSSEFRRNPYPYYRILRDHYPVFHDRLHNCYYVTRYDDVEASYFDEIGFNTIPKGSSSGVLGNTQLELSGIEHRRRRNIYGRHLVGAALTKRLPALRHLARDLIDQWWHPDNPKAVEVDGGTVVVELGRCFANEFPIGVVAQVLGIPAEARDQFNWWYDAMMSGLGGSDTHHEGLVARQDLEQYVGSLVEQRRTTPTYLYDEAGEQICKDIISELCHAEIDGDVMSTEEITSFVALVVGGGGETTRGGLANLWFQLLTNPDQLDVVRNEPRLVKQAWHEALRHSPSVHRASRFARHEVERFGRLIPAGALLLCSAAAANRDPRAFADPDSFLVERRDLCQREPRGQYRADGLPSGIAFGLGRPSVHPAMPKDRPRSRYALVRDVAVTASRMLLDAHPEIRVAPDASPVLRSLRLGEMHTCWELPVEW